MIRDTFQKMSGWIQLLFLFFFFILGQTLAVLIVGSLLDINLLVGMENLTQNELWRVLSVSTICSFLLPALFCASLFSKKTEEYLAIDRSSSLVNFGLAVLSIIAIQPFISLIGEWNQNINLPQSLHLMEESAKQITEKIILINPSGSALMINIVVLALLPAIAEEFFFRGIIQQTIQRISNNKHVAIWITAIIFSFVHFQFYGFFPRLFLGALLGYIFMYSRSLWAPILVHFINNALSILLFRQYHDNKSVIDFGTGETSWLALISLITTAGTLIYMYKANRKTDSF